MRRRAGRLLILVMVPLVFVSGGLLAEHMGELNDLRLAIQRTPASFPSSQTVPREAIRSGQSVLSVYTEADSLWNPTRGLLTNPLKRGREWERPATVSYFDGGRLVFAAGAGLRVHGGKSRVGSPVQSFRLYFRRSYGAEEFRAGVLFDGQGDPLTHLVAHNDLRQDGDGRWWHFVNPLAYDIAARVGAIVPSTKPVLFILNGEPQGVYVLTEHVRRPFLEPHFGHRNFERATRRTRARLSDWVRDTPSLSWAAAEEHFDIKSLTNWFVSILFCATTDPFQGLIFRDMTDQDSRWFWVNWDMDHSFMDLYRRAREPWRLDTFRATLRRRALEARLLSRLIEEDRDYRDYLVRTILDALNHLLTPEFLGERYRHYRSLAERYNIQELEYFDVLERFLELRHAEVARRMPRYLGGERLVRVNVRGPNDARFIVDGYDHGAEYEGWYTPGMEVQVRLATARNDFAGWTLNGGFVQAPEVWHRVASNTEIILETTSGG